MKAKKSQITIFIIAGIVMLLVAGFLLYLGGSVKTRKEALYADNLPITKYVNECLKRFTGEAVSHLSSQAGYIYKSQGGSVIDPVAADEGKLYIGFEGRKVPYLIRRIPTDDSYPWAAFPEAPLTGELTFIFPISASYMQSQRQFERQIEAYVENKMSTNECVNFAADFKDYSVKASKPKATATLTDKDVFVKLKMPVESTELPTGTRFSLREFSTAKKSSIRKLYGIAKIIVDQDNSNFLFNINEIPEVDGVTITAVNSAYKKDDVIVLEDKAAETRLVFARQNRKPALHYIKSPVSMSQLKAYDPDEDTLTFEVIGNTVKVSDGQFEDMQTGVTITS